MIEQDSVETYGGGVAEQPRSSTPPSPSHKGAGLGKRKFSCPNHESLFTFHPTTCLALVKSGALSSEQLEFESSRLVSFGCAPWSTDTESVIQALEGALVKSCCAQFRSANNHLKSLTDNLSCIDAESKALADKLKRARTLPTPPTPRSSRPSSPLPLSSTPVATHRYQEGLDSSVCSVFDYDRVDFRDLSVPYISTLLPELFSSDNHSRSFEYFGGVGYRYGDVRHKAKPYPDFNLFRTTLEPGIKSVVPDFSLDTYTCLVNYYPDGKAGLNLHADNEGQIVDGSSIITVSVGAERDLTLVSQQGAYREHKVSIPHGSVYTMSKASQAGWKHAVDPDINCKEPRISFTFRQLIPEESVPKPPRAPPITRPEQYKPPVVAPKGSHHKILMLTDSILRGSPEHVFNRIPGHRCVKQSCKQLTQMFDWESDFTHCSLVVISSGINDLSCYGKTADSLSSTVLPRLEKACQDNPDTMFVFNSILDTAHPWLNTQSGLFNRNVFRLAEQLNNLFFFDSHHLLTSNGFGKLDKFEVLQRGDNRGVHITFAARRLITDNLVSGLHTLGFLKNRCGEGGKDKGWKWPVRDYFITSFRRRNRM